MNNWYRNLHNVPKYVSQHSSSVYGTNGEVYDKHCGILYEFLHQLFMKILAIFYIKHFFRNRGNYSD